MYTNTNSMHKKFLICITIFIIAAAVRLYHIEKESVWYDESVAVYELAPGISLTRFLYSVEKVDPTLNPLYFSVLWAWSSVFGNHVIVLRLLSIILGASVIVVLYLMGQELYFTKMELFASVTYGILCVPGIYFSQEIRMYAAFLLFTTVSLHAFICLLKYGDRKSLAINIIANILLVWTHMHAAPFLLVQGIIILFVLRRKLVLLILWGGPQAFNVLVWWLFWGRYIDFERIQSAAAWIGNRSEFSFDHFFRIWYLLLAGPATSFYTFWIGATTLVLAVLAVIQVLVNFKNTQRTRWEAVLCMLFLWLPLGSLFLFSTLFYPVLVYRYIIYTQIPMIVAVILGSRGLRTFRSHVLFVLVILFCLQYITLERPTRPDWNTVIQQIDDGRPVFITPFWQEQTLMPLLRKPKGVELDSFPYVINENKARIERNGGWLVLERNSLNRYKDFLDIILDSGFMPVTVRSIKTINGHIVICEFN